ncbi:DHA2 family efflux MFS transporter permease subunit [Rhizosphaericola mali]|uniref:DHA2 family efflux MFS transporter permease subunit n=1 Tax=Rhizosphaericola mali TaxID=2545455 RepID=A0A5P2FXI1_9BACT|nr:DHA2 family efflux MFS transporter permease subunit [Rhizosphaericola mali]QES88234.1 DHA2 family efflux MFS transporter permease subunit [Rhizosphaericola mali]
MANNSGENALVEYGARRVIITITVILCALLEIVDTTIVNVALNDMKGSLGATLNEIGWVVTAYAIGNVIVIPMTSWLSQQFGRKQYFATSIVIFTLCSFLCGNATSMTEIIAFRFIQGMGGGALLVTSQTIITEIYPKEKQGIAQALYGMGVIVGPTLGPPLGGYIIDNYSWPDIFYINIPLGIVATILSLRYVKNPPFNNKKSGTVDWWGIIFLAFAVGTLQYVLEKGQEEDWFSSTPILTCSIISVISFYLFIWRELVFEKPIVNLRVLKNKNLAVGTVLMFILGFGLYGSTFILPIYTQNSLGWTALQSGLLLVPSSLATAFMMPIVGTLIQKGVPQKILASLGMFLFFAYSMWGYTKLTSFSGEGDFFKLLMVRGVGLSLLFIPITTLSLSSLKGQEIGEGASFTGMMRQLGGSFGVALITTYMTRTTQQHRVDMIGHLNPTNPIFVQRLGAFTQKFISSGMTPDKAHLAAMQAIEGQTMGQAAILSYMDIWMFLGILFLATIPFILIVVKNKKGAKVPSGMH